MPDAEEEHSPAATPQQLEPSVRDGVWVVIAAYNEENAIAGVVSELRRRYANVVVVDDGSTDGTHAAARAVAAFTLRHPVNRGQGAALQTGIEFALSRGASYVVTFDADGQHDPDDIAALVAPIASGEAAITLGSRFLSKTERPEGMPALRRATLKAAVVFTRLVNRMPLTDAHNGLRCFNAEAASRISIKADRMAHASEIIDHIRRTNLPVREVPVNVRYTEYSLAKGQTSSAGFKILFHYFMARLFD